jgi:uncharacterized protein YkwD
MKRRWKGGWLALFVLGAAAELAVAQSDPLPEPLAAREVEVAETADAAPPPALVFAPPPATLQEQLAALINIERATCTAAGCPLSPLKLVPLLTGVADAHSFSMAIHDFFSHYDPSDGCSSPQQRVNAAGYTGGVGENAAAGNDTAAETVAQWMGSPGHAANILASGYRETGVGYYGQAGDQANIDLILNSDCDCVDAGETCNGGPWTWYWTEIFGSRTGVYPLVIEGEAHQTSSGNVDLYAYGPAGADDMRFSNDGVNWSSWQVYDATTSWSLAAGDGHRFVYSEVRNGVLVYRGCDGIWRTGAGGNEIFVDSFDCDGLAAWNVVTD